MEEERKTKLDNPIRMIFRVEKIHADLLQGYCDDNGFNQSAVLRRMLIDFLKKLGVY